MARHVLSATFVVLLIVAGAVAAEPPMAATDPSAEGFAKFEAHFGKRYATREARLAAYNHFRAATLRALDAQAKNPHATFALNSRSDQPRRTLRAMKRSKEAAADVAATLAATPVPSQIDWRTRGAVGPVRNQGQCAGSVVTFSLASVADSINFINKFQPTLVELSAQQMLDCSPSGQCTCESGCLPEGAVNSIVGTNHGLWDTAASYPYNTNYTTQTCREHEPSMKVGARLEAYVPLPKLSKEKLQAAIVTSPVAVGVYAGRWCEYESGVMSDCSGPIDHVAEVVGYDAEANPPYWIVKNSWGTEFGENGYIRLSMNGNTCNILDMPFTLKLAAI